MLRDEKADLKFKPGLVPAISWVDRPRAELSGAVRCAEAEWSVVDLLVVEMGGAVLSRAPLNVPRISWSLHDTRKDEEASVGGPAPSFEDAKLRAELALRAYFDLEMDG